MKQEPIQSRRMPEKLLKQKVGASDDLGLNKLAEHTILAKILAGDLQLPLKGLFNKLR